MPVPIYTRNFIKTYAHTLGVDSKPILESYENYLCSLQIAEIQSTGNIPENVSLLVKIGRYKPYLWTAAVLISIIIVSLYIFSQYQPTTVINNNPADKTAAIDMGKKTDSLPPAPLATVSENEQAKAAAQPTSNEANKTKQMPIQPDVSRQESASVELRASNAQNARAVTKSGEKVSLLIIKATEETWIRIKADKDPSYQILLKPGEKIERKAANFDLDIGNAGGIRIQFNGKNIENLGKSGQVIRLRLPEFKE